MLPLASLASVTLTSFLVIVLARAVWHKVERFLETVGFAQGYGLVPESWAAPIVRALTLAETVAIVALMVPAWRMAGGVFAAGLFAGYGIVMAVALAQGRERIDCGCGGLPQIVSSFTLGRNAVLVAMALSVAMLPATALPRPDVAIAIAGALVLAAIYAVIERLASHLPHIRQGEI